MSITRRQFVTRLGALAATVGMSQADISKVTEAFAHDAANSPWTGDWTNKPKVIWLHGAECTGCSTSLLGFFEDVTGSIDDTPYSTLAALDLAVGGNGDGEHVLGPGVGEFNTAFGTSLVNPAQSGHPWGHRTLHNTDGVCGTSFDTQANSLGVANIADVLLDFISLEYHETVMGMGGDLAFQWLNEHLRTWNSGTNSWNDDATNTTPFVLVVEGSLSDPAGGGFWNETGSTPWCAIGMDGTAAPGTYHEHEFSFAVQNLAEQDLCVAVIAVGQCATFGGFPASMGPGLLADTQAGIVKTENQTGAKGVHKFLNDGGGLGGSSDPVSAANKVINVPGCPTNPWWVVLTIVAWMVDASTALLSNGAGALGILADGGAILPSAVDSDRRLNLVYNYPIHSGRCPRFNAYRRGEFAENPGDDGCLLMLGCSGPSTKSLCPRHGWNNQQPNNSAAIAGSHNLLHILDEAPLDTVGGFCITAGSPCKGCTENGYPDAFTPFVIR